MANKRKNRGKNVFLIGLSGITGAFISNFVDRTWKPNDLVGSCIIIAGYTLFTMVILYFAAPFFGSFLDD